MSATGAGGGPLRRRWIRVSASNPCPICGRPNPQHTSRWCTISEDGKAAHCMFVPGGIECRGGGWIHRTDRIDSLRPAAPSLDMVPIRSAPSIPIEVSRDRVTSVKDGAAGRALAQRELEEIAARLGVTAAALFELSARVDCRSDGQLEPVLFPMRDEQGQVIGVRRRYWSGRKLTEPGTHEGLFIPTSILVAAGMDVELAGLAIVEGPTDTAAAISAGLWAVGRPSNIGGHALLEALLRRLRPPEVIVIMDRDAGDAARNATLAGARKLKDAARMLGLHAITLPVPEPHKDLRDMYRQLGGLGVRRWIQLACGTVARNFIRPEFWRSACANPAR